MDVKQLRAFLTISETNNITKAAAMLNIVQPAVSRQIHLLEEELGVELFERGRHGMTLTQEGKVLEGYARRALREIEAAKTELTSKDGGLKGTVNIGILASLSELLSVALMKVIKKKYPDVNLKISVGYSGHLKEWLEAGEIDLALLYDSIPSKFIDSHQIVSEQLWLIGPYSSHLHQSLPLDLNEISELPLILPYVPHQLRSLIDHGFQVEKLDLKIAAEINDLSVQKQLVKEGLGFTILPLVSVKNDLQLKTVKVSPINHSEFYRKIAIALPNTRHISKLVHVIASETYNCCKVAVDTKAWLGSTWISDR
ncbi:LysR substrate-binding domain-containing protein [Acinetobacter baumannii]|uniref:LysR substrate-binding domain-containing protein n=1 Tax=Acinetobacter baumannii TaxID=470 RepID=UPI002448CCB1|nr:LysR substrate-binding domain-containing protein [Acinetobacter baumannii]MDH2498731.1 LysR substrate-binding domain-containing protein [Acinetobacter baumannii]